MGDPRRARRTYEEPTHPWKGDRIEREDEYVRKYGLKNKKEFWKAESMLRDQRAQARNYLPLVLRDDPQGKKEADQLLGKLNRLGVLEQEASLDDVLALNVDSILSRRLQTVTFLKGLAATPKQARQFITHGHIAIGGRRVDVPGYLVRRDEEQAIEYAPTSPLQNEAHPLRQGVEPSPADDAEVAEEIAEDVEEVLEDEEPDAEEPDEAEEEAEDEAGDETDEEPEASGDEEPDAEEPDEAEEEAEDEADETEPDEADEADEEASDTEAEEEPEASEAEEPEADDADDEEEVEQ